LPSLLFARSWKRWKFGMASAASTPRIATTIISSISVKPRRRDENPCMTLARSNGSANCEAARSAMRDAEPQTTGVAGDPDLPVGSMAGAGAARG
jgi:hypothetical protein